MADEHPVDSERVAAARERAVPVGEARDRGALMTLLADPQRARLLVALLDAEEACVGDLALALGGGEGSTRYPLRVLRSAGPVRRRAEGRRGHHRHGTGSCTA